MAHFGSIQMGILIRPYSLHTDLPICSSWQISFSCSKSSDLFFWLNPLAFLLFSSAFNYFIVIFEEFRIIRACGFWKGSFTWLPVRVTCMPFLSAFFNVLIPLSVVSLFISMSLSLSHDFTAFAIVEEHLQQSPIWWTFAGLHCEPHHCFSTPPGQ